MGKTAKKSIQMEEEQVHDIFDRIMRLPVLRLMWTFYHKYKGQ